MNHTIDEADTLSFETKDLSWLAIEFRRLREVTGHFSGGPWNDSVDKWMGRKHRLMLEIGSRLAKSAHRQADLVHLLGYPDGIVQEHDTIFNQLSRQTTAATSESVPPDKFLIYYWRSHHDFLFFAYRNKAMTYAGWWYAGE